ncbi:MAG: hypothetical protein COB42_06720 [Sulfurimonas sp.]|nr:MAG: hypothetical protein COB42_06720 [Sulfurimonas sp.]
MWEWLGSNAAKVGASIVGSGLSAYGQHKNAKTQKKQFNSMFNLEKSQLARENKKEDDRQDIINSVYKSPSFSLA